MKEHQTRQKPLSDIERTVLSKIQISENRADSDILTELKRGIEQGLSERGIFYRTMHIEELKRLVRQKRMDSTYKFVNRDRKINAESYGYEGLVQVKIEGRAVPYNPGKAEGEMLLYSTKNIRLLEVFKGETIYVLEEVKI